MSMQIKNTEQSFTNNLRANAQGFLLLHEKNKWREKQRNLPIGEKVAILGQTILETMELEKIKRYAKGL
jgi:hypothetical protein